MTHEVATAEFSGPLELLLELIEKRRLDISQVSLAEITGDYLARTEELSAEPEAVAAFLHVAAQLLLLKSRHLLHLTEPEEEETSEASLEEQLRRYKQFRIVADALQGLEASGESHSAASQPHLEPRFTPVTEEEYASLPALYAELLQAHLPLPEPELIPATQLSLEERTEHLHRLLKRKSRLDVSTVFNRCQSRLEVVVTFLALLDILRHGAARVSQERLFAPITLEAL